jgi:hypothetical protein
MTTAASGRFGNIFVNLNRLNIEVDIEVDDNVDDDPTNAGCILH